MYALNEIISFLENEILQARRLLESYLPYEEYLKTMNRIVNLEDIKLIVEQQLT